MQESDQDYNTPPSNKEYQTCSPSNPIDASVWLACTLHRLHTRWLLTCEKPLSSFLFAKVWSPRMHQMMLCEQPMQRELRIPSLTLFTRATHSWYSHRCFERKIWKCNNREHVISCDSHIAALRVPSTSCLRPLSSLVAFHTLCHPRWKNCPPSRLSCKPTVLNHQKYRVGGKVCSILDLPIYLSTYLPKL